MNTETSLYKGIKILAIIGIILASYLLYSYYTCPDFQPCSMNASINCDEVIKGEVATTLGIPTGWYGFVGYVSILIAAIYKKKKIVLGFATFGLLFCLRLMYIELFLLKVICPVCVTCMLAMTGVFGLTTKLNLMKEKES